MFWFLLWTGLILAWLVGVFFGLRWLWRQVKQFMDAAAQAGQVLERLEQAGGFNAQTVRPVDVWANSDQLKVVTQELGSRRRDRRARRRAAHQRTYERWARLAGYAP